VVVGTGVFGRKMGVESSKTFENFGKFTKVCMKLAKVSAQRLKKWAQCWKILEGLSHVGKNLRLGNGEW
jgi:hypothetical protein